MSADLALYLPRVRDWLYGITTDRPDGPNSTVTDGEYEAEELLAMYHLVQWPKDLGGANVRPGVHPWDNVKSTFPLHNSTTNQRLLRHLGRRLFLRVEDLDMIRDLFGPKVMTF
jgi:anoctamin-10